MPKLKRKVSVSSVDDLEIGAANEKFKGPIGVNQSTPKPTELLIALESSIVEL